MRMLVCLLAFLARNLFAQTPPLPYWQHSEWVGENRPPIAGDWSLSRSTDGYLWIGARNALIRFDGIRFTVFDSTNTPAFRNLETGTFYPGILDKNGRQWILGPRGSRFNYADGIVKRVSPTETDLRGETAQDGAGRMWIGTTKGLRIMENDRLIRSPLVAGVPDSAVFGLARDTADGLWIGTQRNGLWHAQRSGVTQFGTGRIRALLQTRDGVVWAVGEGLGASGLFYLSNGQWIQAHTAAEPTRSIRTRSGTEGADGSVWFGTTDMGLLRWFNGQFEQFSRADGLSNNRVHDVYVDSEGVVWTSTDAGLDRLRPSTFASIEKRNGLPYDGGTLFGEDSSGAIWLTQGNSTYLLDGGIIRNRPGAITSRSVPIKLNDPGQLIAVSRHGGVWLGPQAGGVLRTDMNGATTFRAIDSAFKTRTGVAFEASDGAIWTKSISGGEIGRFREGKYKPFKPYPEKQTGYVFAEDALGRMWLATDQRHITVLNGDSIVSRILLPKHVRLIADITAEAGDTMWLSTYTSLFRIIGERVAEVIPPGLQQLMVTNNQLAVSGGALWISGEGGFARIPLNQLHRAADGGAAVSNVEIFGPLDGVTVAQAPSLVPTTIRVARDKRVWFATPNGLAVADPKFRMVTLHPRHIRIEEFSVGERTLPVRDGEEVAPLPSRISFRFTIPTTLLAERVRLQYRLEGADDAWIDATVPRIATYNQLRPGSYTFHVRGWDETGKPVPDEAALTFRVLPTWYQSWWFALFLCVIFVGILFVAYRMRLRQLKHAYNVRLEERTAERTRIARELHDTLLQSFQGLMFRLQAVREMLPVESAKAIPVLDIALLKGEEAIDQARSAVSDLRASERVERNLNAGLTAIANEAVHLSKGEIAPAWKIETTGSSREIAATALYELHQVLQEAIYNAFRHARAANVSAEVHYGTDTLRITVADDGIGFDETMRESARKPGHFGVQGMVERIERLGGTMTLRSELNQGTRIILSVPAAVAYRKESTR